MNNFSSVNFISNKLHIFEVSFKSVVFAMDIICFKRTNNNSILFLELISIWAICLNSIFFFSIVVSNLLSTSFSLFSFSLSLSLSLALLLSLSGGLLSTLSTSILFSLLLLSVFLSSFLLLSSPLLSLFIFSLFSFFDFLSSISICLYFSLRVLALLNSSVDEFNFLLI